MHKHFRIFFIAFYILKVCFLSNKLKYWHKMVGRVIMVAAQLRVETEEAAGLQLVTKLSTTDKKAASTNKLVLCCCKRFL